MCQLMKMLLRHCTLGHVEEDEGRLALSSPHTNVPKQHHCGACGHTTALKAQHNPGRIKVYVGE